MGCVGRRCRRNRRAQAGEWVALISRGFSIMRIFRMAAVVGLVAAPLVGLSTAHAGPAGQAPSRCFNTRDWSGWTMSGDAKSMYIRTGGRSVYRLDFASACHAAQDGGSHLITRLHGSSMVCSPLDLDLKVSVGRGMAVPCIVSKITPLSSEEASALPKGLKP
jgi:hypothetical protein